jgi:hypothetical protein
VRRSCRAGSVNSCQNQSQRTWRTLGNDFPKATSGLEGVTDVIAQYVYENWINVVTILRRKIRCEECSAVRLPRLRWVMSRHAKLLT